MIGILTQIAYLFLVQDTGTSYRPGARFGPGLLGLVFYDDLVFNSLI